MANLGVVTGQFTDNVLRGSLMEAFRVSLESTKPKWKEIGAFEEKTSKKAFEEIAEFAGLGLAPRKEELAQIAVDVVKQGYTKRINQLAYAIQMPVSEEAKRFKQYNEAIDGAKSIAESLQQTQEVIMHDVFGNAFSTTLGLGPDALCLCSTAHKLPRGGTFATAITAASISSTAIEAMMILARKMPGSNGLPVGVQMKTILVPEDRLYDARRILKSDGQWDTANRSINALAEDGLQIKASRYLPSTTNWFGLTDAKMGLLVIWTQKPEFREYGVDSTRAHIFDGYQMFGVDWVNPRRVIGSNF